jgi:division protein CdvB (Snf7/Vps24/ESCRT-III family)
MEYDDHYKPQDATQLALQNITERLNEQSRTIADLRTRLEAAEARLDEATHMTSEEYGNQVVEQVMAAMPIIQAEAMKGTKRGGRR